MFGRVRRLTAVAIAVLAGGTSFGFGFVSSASAENRCNSNGTPSLQSGRFTNNSTREFKVKGDRRRSDGKFETATVFVYPGQNAYTHHKICDADHFYNFVKIWNWGTFGYEPLAAYTWTKIGLGTTECHMESVQNGRTVTKEAFCKH